MQAIWNETVIAASDATIELDGDHYFPASAVDMTYLKASTHNTTDPSKGKAYHYHLEVDGERNENAAWYYPNPEAAARPVEGCITFGNGVEVVDE